MKTNYLSVVVALGALSPAVYAAQPKAFNVYVSTPAQGESVGEFRQAAFEFTELTENGLNVVQDAALNRISLIREADNKVFHPSGSAVDGDAYNILLLNFSSDENEDVATPFTLAGSYRLTIPANTLTEYSTDVTNPREISLSFTVDPSLNFSCTLSPESNTTISEFPLFTLSPSEKIVALSLAESPKAAPTLTSGSVTYELTPSCTDGCVSLGAPAEAAPSTGDWTLTIPAGFLSGEKADGSSCLNPRAITAVYHVREAMKFGYTTDPSDNVTSNTFKSIKINIVGDGLKSVSVNPDFAPYLTDERGNRHALRGEVNGKGVIVKPSGSLSLTDGVYTVTVPRGFITTVDSYGLKNVVDVITLTYNIVGATAGGGYDCGILILNEGWFGAHGGSLNFLANDGTVTPNAFALVNDGAALGITAQYATCFGNRLYVVSKQSSPEAGGLLTVVDAPSLRMVARIADVDGLTTGGRSFCGVSATKGYLTMEKGVYIVDLEKNTIDPLPVYDVSQSRLAELGDILHVGSYAFTVQRYDGVIAIDPETDLCRSVDVLTAQSLFTTAKGHLYAATANESGEFVRIDPYTLQTQTINVAGVSAKALNIWDTWRKAPIAADRDAEVIYYIVNDKKKTSYTTAAKFNLETGEYVPDFVRLPEGQEFYGEGISVDPATGLIVLMAVESGMGSHYQVNYIHFASPATGAIIPEKTIALEPYYWFPAMAIYPDFSAPDLQLDPSLTLATGETATANLRALTLLDRGNHNLVRYSVSLSPQSGVSATVTPQGTLEITAGDTPTVAALTVTATYQGKSTVRQLTVSVTNSLGALSSPDSPTPLSGDVYTPTGVLVLRNATPAAIRTLPRGLYILNGQKLLR